MSEDADVRVGRGTGMLMDSTLVRERADALEQSAGNARTWGFLSAVVALVLVLAGTVRLWQSAGMRHEQAGPYQGSAMALCVLGVVTAIVAATGWLLGAQRESTAELVRAGIR